MDRRAFVILVGGSIFAGSPAAEAQQTRRTLTVGYLGSSSPSREFNLVDAFREGLRQLGYEEGQNLAIEYRWAEGQQDRYAGLARELVALKPDVILTAGTVGTLAAKQATQSIPIVTAAIGEPVAVGLVSSLAKPGGNITGLATFGSELEAKRLELLRQVVPKLSQVAVLVNPTNPFSTVAWKQTQGAAEALGVGLLRVEVKAPHDLDGALNAIKLGRVQGLAVIPDRLFLAYRGRIIAYGTTHRLPGVFPFPEFAQEGGLMTYGPDYTDMFRRAATYVDRIFKGAKPGDIPVEQPTKFELVINMKTAKVLGLAIPQTVLLQATQVIE